MCIKLDAAGTGSTEAEKTSTMQLYALAAFALFCSFCSVLALAPKGKTSRQHSPPVWFHGARTSFPCFVILCRFQPCVSFKWTRVPAEETSSATITTPLRRSASFSATEVAREMPITSRVSRSARKRASGSRVSTRRVESALYLPLL